MRLVCILEENTLIDFSKPQPVYERKKNKVVEEQSKEPFLELVNRE
jgi:hypothetical protein